MSSTQRRKGAGQDLGGFAVLGVLAAVALGGGFMWAGLHLGSMLTGVLLLDVFGTALRTLTDTPSLSVRINLGGVTFLAAAGARTLISDTAPYRDGGADVEVDANPHITRILQLLDIHRLPRLHLSCRGVRAKS